MGQREIERMRGWRFRYDDDVNWMGVTLSEIMNHLKLRFQNDSAVDERSAAQVSPGNRVKGGGQIQRPAKERKTQSIIHQKKNSNIF